MEIDLNPSGVVIQEALGCYEIILPAERGPELWEYLLEVGRAVRPRLRRPRRPGPPRRRPPLRLDELDLHALVARPLDSVFVTLIGPTLRYPHASSPPE